MRNNEDTDSLGASVSTNVPDDRSSTPISAASNGRNGNADEPDLDSLAIKKLLFSAEAAKLAALPHLAKNIDLEDFFVTQRWHRPYAEALLNSNPMNLPVLIAQAEHAIRERYVELSITPSPTDELVDLRHAVEALAQLKAASHSVS
jgi:hypothetical protein